MLALALAALLSQCEDSGVADPGVVEGCAPPCSALTVPLPPVQPGDVIAVALGVDGMSAVVDGGAFWEFRVLRRSAPSQFGGWLFTRIADGGEPGQWTFGLSNVDVLGGSAVATGHRGVAIVSSDSVVGQQTDPPRSPAVNAQAGDRLVDYFVTDTNNPDAGWIAPAGTCGRKLRGRVAFVDQRVAVTGVVPIRTTSQPVVDGPTVGIALLLRPVDAGTRDAGTPDAGTPDAGTPDAGTPDAGTPDAGTPDAGTPDAGTPDAGTPDAGTTVTDGGPPLGPKDLRVGCGCSAGTDGGFVFALMSFALVRFRPGRRIAATLVALFALNARGQVVADDFEAATLNGAWTSTPCGTQSLAPSTNAAHRGQRGLRLEDTQSTESCFGANVRQSLPANVRDFYSRAWVRLTKRNVDGDSVTIHTGFDPTAAAHSWQIDFQNQLKAIEQPLLPDGGVQYHAVQTNHSLRDGGWALLEACTLNRGSTAATAVYAVDGVELTRTTFPAIATNYDFFAVGEVYTAKEFTGIVDFDDIRADTQPQASRLTLSAGALKTNTCGPVTIALAASLPSADGGSATPLAPYAIALALGGAAFFRDDGCTTEEAAPAIAKGANALTLFVKPATGTLRLTAAHPDFLPAGLDTGVADGGTGASAPKSLYAMGCTSAGGAPLVLLALLSFRRRPSGRTS